MIQEAIQRVDGWRDMSAGQLHTALTTTDERPDPTLWTFGAIGRTIGIQFRAKMNATLLAIEEREILLPEQYADFRADIVSARQALGGNGFRLDEPETQSLIDLVATLGQWPADMITAVKGLGVIREKSLWIESTTADVAAAVDAINAREYGEELLQRIESAARIAMEADGATRKTVLAAINNEIGKTE